MVTVDEIQFINKDKAPKEEVQRLAEVFDYIFEDNEGEEDDL